MQQKTSERGTGGLHLRLLPPLLSSRWAELRFLATPCYVIAMDSAGNVLARLRRGWTRTNHFLGGDWSAVERIVEIGGKSRGWPIVEGLVLGALSNHIEENPKYWLQPSSERWLRFAEIASRAPYLVYIVIALIAGLLTVAAYRRLVTRKKRQS